MPGSRAGPSPLAVVLYRRCLAVVRRVDRGHAQKRALARWAEFLPPSFILAPGVGLTTVVRQCFEAPATSHSFPQAFLFLREASSSLPTLEMLALWEELQQRAYPFLEGLALQAAVLRSVPCSVDGLEASASGAKNPGHEPLRHRMAAYHRFLEDAVSTAHEKVRALQGGHNPSAVTVESLKTLILTVHDVTGYARRGIHAEDYTIDSLHREKKASEDILNVFLFLLLERMGLRVSLVGVDLSFRWVGVQPTSKKNGSQLIFATWSYGAFDRDALSRFVHTQNSQWFLTKPWDTTFRRTLLCALLRKQLSCFGSAAHSDGESASIAHQKQKACKEQLLFLLT